MTFDNENAASWQLIIMLRRAAAGTVQGACDEDPMLNHV